MIKKPYGLHAMLCKSHYEVQRILNEGESSIAVIENWADGIESPWRRVAFRLERYGMSNSTDVRMS